MALNAALLCTSVPWQLSYAAGLPALSLLQSGINCRTWSSSTSSTPIKCQHAAIKAGAPTAIVANPAAAQPAQPAVVPSSTTTAAHALYKTRRSWSFAKPGQSHQFFSESSFAVGGLRGFSANPLPHEEDTEADRAVLPGGRHHPTARAHRHRVQHALHILQHGNVLTLRDMLAVKAETNFHITYDELIHMSKESGAAHTQQEAEELAEALSRSGVVMRYRSIIYLRPQEVADIIIKALPDSELEAQQKVQEIDAELEAMHSKIEQVDRTADRWARVWLWGGCGLLALQLAAFVRLTWWELSWDVMEPFGYVIGLANTLVGYIYFMIFRNNLDYKPFQDYWKSRTRSKAALENQVDIGRYEELLKLRSRYVQHMKAISSDLHPLPTTATQS